jgi:hypothetical protein
MAAVIASRVQTVRDILGPDELARRDIGVSVARERDALGKMSGEQTQKPIDGMDRN